MANLDDLFLDEEPAPSLAVPRKGRLQKGRSASPETKPPQRKKEGLGRKRPAAAARSESGSDSDAPSAAPSAEPKKKKTRAATADYSESFKRLVMSHALRLPKSGRVKPTCKKFSTDDRTLRPVQIRRWLTDRGLMVDVFRALQRAPGSRRPTTSRRCSSKPVSKSQQHRSPCPKRMPAYRGPRRACNPFVSAARLCIACERACRTGEDRRRGSGKPGRGVSTLCRGGDPTRPAAAPWHGWGGATDRVETLSGDAGRDTLPPSLCSPPASALAGSSSSPSGRRRRWRGRLAALGGPAFASRPHPGRGGSREKPRSRRRRRRARPSR